MLRTAMIGAERIGRARAVTATTHPQARLVPVYDPFIRAAKALAESPGARTSADAAEAFSAGDVGAVVIGSPAPLHTEYVLAAARTGKAALCEKPIASPVRVAHALTDELATFERLPVMVGFQRRYDPSIAKAQRLAAEGRIGRIGQLTIVSRDPVPSSAKYLTQSGGVFKDMTIHDFDEARFSPGEIVSVNATGQRLNPALTDVDDFDGAVTTLRVASGAVAIIKNTRHCASGYDQKVEAFEFEGEAVAENLRATSVQINDATGSAQQEVYLDFFLEHYTDTCRDEFTAFIGAVNSGSFVTPTVEGGVAALVPTEAAERSVCSGQTVEVTK